MAKTKEELLKYFATLDIPRLQRLEKYSKLIIVPDEDLLTNVTMSQLVDKAHDIADSVFPEWTDRGQSDFGEFLVELFALFSEKDFWYINAFANESILRKMRSYSNAFSKASSMGYQAVTCKSASASFNVTFKAGGARTYHKGDLAVNAGGMKFTNWDDIVIEESASETTKQVTLYEGYVYAEDTQFSGYSVLIRKENINIDKISLSINDVEYSKVGNFGFSSPDSTHYIVLPEEDGSIAIFFGDRTYGSKPSIGTSVHVEYIKTNGAKGNIPISESTISECLPTREATKVTMLSAAKGGTDADSFSTLREKAATYFATKRAVINEAIAEETLKDFPFIHKAKAKVQGRVVTYMVVPMEGTTLSDTYKATLRSDFEPYFMAGYEPTFAENQYVDLLTAIGTDKLVVDVIVSSGYDLAAVKSGVMQVISDVTNPLVRADYGKGISKANLDILIRSSVSGVQSCTFKDAGDNVINDVELTELEIFQTIDTSKIEVRLNVI